MSDLLKTVAAYVPPGIIRKILAEPAPTPPSDAESGAIEAAILFADVSGFTPLTEALAQKGAEGPEELTRLLNTYFSRMITLIEAESGEVVKFSGDAVTVMFPVKAGETLGQATRHAKQAAETMQAAMSEFSTLQTSVGPVALGMKIGIGAGEILTALVGGVFNRWEYVIAGDPLRQVAEAEHQAERGDIVLSPEAEAILYPTPLPPNPLQQPDWSQLDQPDAVEEVLRSYVPGAIVKWLAEGGEHDWLKALRPMSVLFIGVGGLDYEKPDAVNRLHNFLHSAQEIIYKYEGSINKLAVDDKGTIFITLFGAPPLSHEDDPERALRCAMELQEMAQGQQLQLAIGATTGRVFTGPVGSETRREYTVMGDTVNLAARLMGTAGLGQIRCDHETYRLTNSRLAFEALSPVRLKGKAGLIPLYKPVGEVKISEEVGARSGRLVGRRKEVAAFKAGLDTVQAGRTQIIVLEGEAGIGKSRLVEELIQLAQECGMVSMTGMGRSIEQQTPYRAWRDIFTTFFALDTLDNPAKRLQHVEHYIREATPDLIERTPLLNDLLNLGFPENELTASLDPETRHESLVALLLVLLRAWASERPLILILEDAHWLDTLSWDLTVQVARSLTVARVPLLLMVAMRSLHGDSMRVEPVLLANMEQADHLELTSLEPDEIVDLAAARLGVTQGGLPEEAARLVTDRSSGNPFIAEEAVYKLRDDGMISLVTEQGQTRCVVSGDLAQAVLTFPDTIQGIVLSRIDRLPPEEQFTLKVAAVIGRTFAYTTLFDTLEHHTDLSERMLKIYLDDLRSLDLTPMEAPEPELIYIFKHIITHEVAYETLLFAQRRQLHRTVAEWYHQIVGQGTIKQPPEKGLATVQETAIAPYYPLLAHHWGQAEEVKWEQHYAWLAGNQAAAQFANVDAANYFTRALELTPDLDLEARYQLLLASEAVNDRSGEREAQAKDLAELSRLADETKNKSWQVTVALRQANFSEVMSDYPASLTAAQQAVELAQELQDQAAEAEGYIAWGKVLWRQGDYEAARERLRPALTLATAIDNLRAEVQSLYYLGHSYLYQDNHARAQEHYEQALTISRSIDYHRMEADSLNMLGIIQYELGNLPGARNYYEQGIAIVQKMGDRPGEAIALSNFGNFFCDLGDFATSRDYQEQALDIRFVRGDREGEANSLTNLGLVYHNIGDNQIAREQCERALSIQQEIGDRHTAGYSLTYLGHALFELGELDAAAAVYQEAMTLRQELGKPASAIDDQAGLARMALAQGDSDKALAYVEEILTWLDKNGAGGIEYPLQVYLICYDVLQAGSGPADSRAADILATAYKTLMQQADAISDVTLRQSFLENVSANREIQKAWAAQE